LVEEATRLMAMRKQKKGREDWNANILEAIPPMT
jgi:hypothetical protein